MTTQPILPAPDDDRLLAADERASAAVDGRVLTAEAFATLTGVRAERLRTWQRRHRFPAPAVDHHGHRGFRASDAPRVVAARQLIEAGEPVASAIDRVRDQSAPDIDQSSLEAAFGAVDTPVVAIGGPAPLQIVWANAAALAQAPADVELPYDLSDRSAHWRRLLVELPDEPVWSAHAPWFEDDAGAVSAEGTAPVSAVAWPAGAPAFVPAVLVVVDVPISEETPPPAAQPEVRAALANDHRWAQSVGAARRALQRGSGRQSLADALNALVTSGLCVDAVLLASPDGVELRPALSACGRHELMRPAEHTAAELRGAAGDDDPAPIGGAALREQLAIEPHEHALVAPLIAGGHDYGYLLAITADPIDLTDDCSALVMALAANLAASMSRNRALRELRRIQG